ncbi:MAG TPA: MBL fold metallo-hydrolase [Syntrophales bacterium]|nr:MBL fold metallo-hydrolase [Syntrophales bacterium]
MGAPAFRLASGCTIAQVLSGRCNAFLLSKGGRHILVDTGRMRSEKKLVDRLVESGVDGRNLSALVLTHTHFDHAENAAAVKTIFGAKILVHRSEADFLNCGDSPLPQGTLFPTRWLIRLFGASLQRLFLYRPVAGDILVDERLDLLDFGFSATVLHLPGHSSGSLSLIVEDEIALVGDTLFGVIRGSVRPPFADDPALLVRSWRRLLDTGCRVFLPGHGRQIGRDLLQRQYEKYQRRYEA